MGLPDGEYVVEVEQSGFVPFKDQVLIAGAATLFDINLLLQSAAEEITVTQGREPPQPATVRRVRKGRAPKCSADTVAKRIGGQIVLPRKTAHKDPTYPQEAHAARRSGRGVVQGVISGDGTITGIRVLEATDADFGRAALEAVREWEFDPKYLNCMPVETRLRVIVNFTI
jgi:TonB family protein